MPNGTPIIPPIFNTGSSNTSNKNSTGNQSGNQSGNKGGGGASAYDWVTGILSVLVPAVPGVILAANGQQQTPPQWQQGADPAYGGNGGNYPPPSAGTSVPVWAWVLIGVAVVGGIVLLLKSQKGKA